jgi:small GTP-binding protein
MDYEADFTCKIIVIGNYQAGKTSLVDRYVKNDFSQHQKTTIGVDFRVKRHDYDGKIIKSYIWDTAGQERFMTIVSSYYRTINGAILVFDLNNKESFQALNAWIKELENNKSSKEINIILVGNKCDIENEVISEDDISDFMKKSIYPISYVKTSAKTGHNVDKVFTTIVQNIYEFHKLKNGESSNEKKIETLQIEQSENVIIGTYWNHINVFGCW